MRHEEALQAAQQPVAEWLKDFSMSMNTMGFHESDPVAMVEGVVRAYLEALAAGHDEDGPSHSPVCRGCSAWLLLSDSGTTTDV